MIVVRKIGREEGSINIIRREKGEENRRRKIGGEKVTRDDSQR